MRTKTLRNPRAAEGQAAIQGASVGAKKVAPSKSKQVRGKQSLTLPSDMTLLVAVGCGGIFYHGLSRMVVWANRRGWTETTLIDPDKIEEKNASRQWGTDLPGLKIVGTFKVRVAQKAMIELGMTCSAYEHGIDKPEGMLYVMNTSGDYKRHYERFERIVVVATPDNHLCRVHVHEGCRLLAMSTGVPVYEVTAGNQLDSGYAYGCLHQWELNKYECPAGITGFPKCVGDWTVRHPDILEEAEKERQRLAEPEACSDMEETAEEQTAKSNQLTAGCIWDLAEMMVRENKVGEVQWAVVSDTNGRGQKNGKRYIKVWANLTTYSNDGGVRKKEDEECKSCVYEGTKIKGICEGCRKVRKEEKGKV